jgi:hypothetical protein
MAADHAEGRMLLDHAIARGEDLLPLRRSKASSTLAEQRDPGRLLTEKH